MLDFHNDSTFKIQYDPQSQMFQFQRNAVGAHSYIEIEEADYTYTDSNSIFVSDTSGNDSTGSGTQAAPYKTILKGCGECTATKSKCIVLDSVLYSESLSTLDNSSFAGLYAATGETPTLSLRALDTTYTDSNAIYVDKTGNDSTGDGTSANPYLTIATALTNVTGTKSTIVIQDSGTYEEPALYIAAASDCDGIVAEHGCTPVFVPTYNADTRSVTDFNQYLSTSEAFATNGVFLRKSGREVYVFYSVSDGSYYDWYYAVYDLVSESYTTTATKFKNDANGQITSSRIVELPNGKFAFLYTYGSGTVLEVFSSSLSYENSVTVTSTAIGTRLGNFGNNYIIVFYSNTGNTALYFKIYDYDCSVVVGETTVISSATTPGVDDIDYFKTSGEVCFSYRYFSGATQYALAKKINTSGSIATVKDFGTSTSGNYHRFKDLQCTYSDYAVIAYSTDDTSNAYYAIYGDDGSVIKAETTLFSYSGTPTIRLTQNSSEEDEFSAVYFDTTDYTFYFRNFGENGTALGAASELQDYAGPPTFYDLNGAFLLKYSGQYDFYMLYPYNGIEAEKEFLIDGLTFDADEDDECGIKSIISSDSALTVKHCTIQNYSYLDETFGVVNGTGATTIKNTVFADNNGSVIIDDNTADVEDCEFRNNSGAYAIDITGTGTGVNVEHDTFYGNYGGVKLQSNGGTEVVKNSIFHESTNYDVTADTALSFTYSTYTGELNTATAGTSVIKSNPLFVNEGAITPANIDLTLKLRVLGYPADSPAYLLADDTVDRDAGCYDNIVIGEETTWTEIELPKPYNNFKPSLEFVGATEVVKDDGTVETSVTGYTETVTISYPDGLEKTYYDDVLAMFVCGENQVRLYPDPTTSPSDYNLYNINYKGCKLPRDAGHYKLGDSGVKGLVIELVRGYS